MSPLQKVTDWTAAAATRLVRERFDDRVASTHWVGSGAWSDCFAFAVGGADLVIRIGRHGEDFRLDAWMGRYRSPDLPIPQTIAVGAIGADHFAISERVPGQAIEQPDQWGHLTDALVGLLEALRLTSPTGLSGWGRWTPGQSAPAATWRNFLLSVDQDPAGTRIHGWKDRVASSPDVQAAFDDAYIRLQASIVDTVPRSLVHGDLINRNVHARNGSISGVFDWGNSLLGDHLYDLAIICFWEPWFPHVESQPIIHGLRARWVEIEWLVSDFEARLRSCVLHIGLEHIAYHAFREDWLEVRSVTDRMNDLADLWS